MPFLPLASEVAVAVPSLLAVEISTEVEARRAAVPWQLEVALLDILARHALEHLPLIRTQALLARSPKAAPQAAVP